MFNFIKKLKFRILKKKIINYINVYGKSETLKNISDIINLSKFHHHDFKNQTKSNDHNFFDNTKNNHVEIISKSKKVLITQSKNQENIFKENVNF